MALIVVGCVVLAACGNGDDADSADAQDTSPVVTEDTAPEEAADEPEATESTELDNIVDGVVVSGPEDVEIGGLPAVTFEVEVTDSAPCGPDYEGEGITGPSFCVGFIVSNVDDDGNIDGYSFEPGFRERVYWVDQGDQAPVVIIAGTRIDDPSFDEQADALLATLAFGDPQPHPIPDAGTPTTTSP